MNNARPIREPTRRGCSYEELRRQKSVRRIARHVVRGAARQADGEALTEGQPHLY
jgi:hypothetical protein